MKQTHSHIGITWLAAAGLALVSAAALAGDPGKINSGSPSVSEVQGRASGSFAAAAVQPVRAPAPRAVSEVIGRGNQTGHEAGPAISVGALEVADLGRATILAKTRTQPDIPQSDVAVASRK
jgi:hypothetical protein